jgi:hypothetical protein
MRLNITDLLSSIERTEPLGRFAKTRNEKANEVPSHFFSTATFTNMNLPGKTQGVGVQAPQKAKSHSGEH